MNRRTLLKIPFAGILAGIAAVLRPGRKPAAKQAETDEIERRIQEHFKNWVPFSVRYGYRKPTKAQEEAMDKRKAVLDTQKPIAEAIQMKSLNAGGMDLYAMFVHPKQMAWVRGR